MNWPDSVGGNGRRPNNYRDAREGGGNDRVIVPENLNVEMTKSTGGGRMGNSDLRRWVRLPSDECLV
jgi:hypothetical protein